MSPSDKTPSGEKKAPPGLYVALSGGGAHAAAHAGVLLGLERAGVPVAGIAGVSGGAIVAAAWAGGADLEKLVDQASRLHPWMWVRGWGGGLLSGSKLGALIDEYLPIADFAGLRVPVRVLATDVDTAEPVVFKEGDVREAVRASCSFPGVFPPMVIGRRRLVIAPSMGESGWMRPVKIPSFFTAGLEALEEALPEVRRLLAGAAAAKAKSA